MDENALHQWLIDCFGQVQGEMAWSQLSQLPAEVRQQLMSQDPNSLPKPGEVQALMQALTAGGLNTPADMQESVQSGPINVKLAKSLALQKANEVGSEREVTAEEGQAVRQAMIEANLWLDTVCDIDPSPGQSQVLTRAGWVEATLDSWASFASPVAQSMGDALTAVLSDRLGGAFEGEISGMFAGPVPIPIPEGMKDPMQLIRLLGNTSFAMQLGQAAGAMSHEVRGSFDQGIALHSNQAGALIAQNCLEYGKALEIDQGEVLAFLALQEVAHARLFAHVRWLMPRFEALIGKYARGVDIDLDAMEEQLREAITMDPESISGAVNLSKVGIADTPEQEEAITSLENLLALVEGWVDCVTWKAGMAHIPHIEQLREMMRRERAVGGPAEVTFESLLGMHLRPKRIREAANIWEQIDSSEGHESRDAKWSHPDLLPTLPEASTSAADTASSADSAGGKASQGHDEDGDQDGQHPSNSPEASSAAGSRSSSSIDWDAELSKLLDEDARYIADTQTDAAPEAATGSQGPASEAADDAQDSGSESDSPSSPTSPNTDDSDRKPDDPPEDTTSNGH
ncbi:hydrolase [Bifidobacterium aemilianum]|uniref:Hydrolase n=1 Tax=Bifidobacterium aemilianum TaxID=2493120 RepID=A0A366KBH2_9BIFI|nr:zinc-dependent metalloprotease [Bifidobacterium aemilianum]RBP98592.1 hydrolase [Bifidobacterium aemilianum]